MIRNDSLKKKSNKRDTPLESEDESLIIFFSEYKRAHGFESRTTTLKDPTQELLCSDEISPGAALRETRPGTG